MVIKEEDHVDQLFVRENEDEKIWQHDWRVWPLLLLADEPQSPRFSSSFPKQKGSEVEQQSTAAKAAQRQPRGKSQCGYQGAWWLLRRW